MNSRSEKDNSYQEPQSETENPGEIPSVEQALKVLQQQHASLFTPEHIRILEQIFGIKEIPEKPSEADVFSEDIAETVDLPEVPLQEMLDFLLSIRWTGRFENVEREYVKSRLSEGEIAKIYHLIKSLSEQFTFSYVSSFQGGCRILERDEMGTLKGVTSQYAEPINKSFSMSRKPLPFTEHLLRDGKNFTKIRELLPNDGEVTVKIYTTQDEVALVVFGKFCRDHANRNCESGLLLVFPKALEEQVRSVTAMLKEASVTSDILLSLLIQDVAKYPVTPPKIVKEQGDSRHYAHYISNDTLAGTYPWVGKIVE